MIDLTFNAETRQTDIVLSFIADEGVTKAGLPPEVVNNHLLTQAGALLRVAADNALHGKDAARIDAEAAAKKAAIDTETATAKAAVVVSDVKLPGGK